eukprot:4088660-Prymnesium_polylepis.1
MQRVIAFAHSLVGVCDADCVCCPSPLCMPPLGDVVSYAARTSTAKVTRVAQRAEGAAHEACPGGIMGALLIMAMLMFLFYSSRNSELESYALTASHPGHHKRIAVTLLDAAGHDCASRQSRPKAAHRAEGARALHADLPRPRRARCMRTDPCDDSDGADKTIACQIGCSTNPCLEPYRLCLAHAECSAIAMSKDLTFATLKRDLFPHIAKSATAVVKVADWQEWWSTNAHANLPTGSYSSSCSECSVAAGVLRCAKCMRSGGAAVEAHAEVSKCSAGTFENHDGALRCTDDASGGSSGGAASVEQPKAYHEVRQARRRARRARVASHGHK